MSSLPVSRGVLEFSEVRGACGWVAGSRIPDPGPPRFPHYGSRIPVILAQDGSRWAHVGPSWPQVRPRDAQNGVPRPPRCLKNASGRPQEDLKIDIFEVCVRKARKCVWSYYSNVLLIFWKVFFHRFWRKN